MTFVSDLEPKELWKHFDKILTIPRASKDEGKMRDYVRQVASSAGLETRSDPAGNVLVSVPASPGHEGAETTILQAHLDMVQEKNSDTDFDFGKDAIRPVREGDYLTADGTTLGSDNGIGVASMLALVTSDDVVHGPLELLFTFDEETGLTGAAELSGDLLTGHRLLNLDTEEEGSVYVGCAGGVSIEIHLPVATTPVAASSAALSVAVSGFRGGHSGVDIHLQRGNAVQLLARAIEAASEAAPLRLATLSGGSAHNAIPREARALVVCSEAYRTEVADAIRQEFTALAAELRPADPDAKIAVDETPAPPEAWDEASSARALELLVALPHGVRSMSYDIPDLVETSSNLATAAPGDGTLEILVSVRSSVDSAKDAEARRVRAMATLAGAQSELEGDYPGWKPDMSSKLLEVVKQVHERVLGTDPEVKAIHAGLETGIIGEKYTGMDMVSIGPQIEFPHSPAERVLIPSVDRYWRLLAAVLKEIA